MLFGNRLFRDSNGKRYRCFVEDGGSRDFIEALLKEGGAKIIRSIADFKDRDHKYILVARFSYKFNQQILDWGWIPVDLEFVVKSCILNSVEDTKKYRLGTRKGYSISFESERKRLFDQLSKQEGLLGENQNKEQYVSDCRTPLATSTQSNPGPQADFDSMLDLSSIRTQSFDLPHAERTISQAQHSLHKKKQSWKLQRDRHGRKDDGNMTMQKAFRQLVANSKEQSDAPSTSHVAGADGAAPQAGMKKNESPRDTTQVGESVGDLRTKHEQDTITAAEAGKGTKDTVRPCEALLVSETVCDLNAEHKRDVGTVVEAIETSINDKNTVVARPRHLQEVSYIDAGTSPTLPIQMELMITTPKGRSMWKLSKPSSQHVKHMAAASPTRVPAVHVKHSLSSKRREPEFVDDGQVAGCSRDPALPVVALGKRKTPIFKEDDNSSTKKRLTDDIIELSSSDDDATSRRQRPVPLSAQTSSASHVYHRTPIPHHRRPPKQMYTWNEKRAILEYLCRHNEFARVKGIAVWESMELAAVCPGRTGQSMKEHFRKQLFPRINSFPFLSENHKKLFRKYSTHDYRRLGPPPGLEPPFVSRRSSSSESSSSSSSQPPPMKTSSTVKSDTRPTPTAPPKHATSNYFHRRLFRQKSLSPSPSPTPPPRRRNQGIDRQRVASVVESSKPLGAAATAEPVLPVPAPESCRTLGTAAPTVEPVLPVPVPESSRTLGALPAVSLAVARSLEMERFFQDAVAQPLPMLRFKRIIRPPVSSDEEEVSLATEEAVQPTTVAKTREDLEPTDAIGSTNETVKATDAANTVEEAVKATDADGRVEAGVKSVATAADMLESPTKRTPGPSTDYVDNSPSARTSSYAQRSRRSLSLPRSLRKYYWKLERSRLETSRLKTSPLPGDESPPLIAACGEVGQLVVGETSCDESTDEECWSDRHTGKSCVDVVEVPRRKATSLPPVSAAEGTHIDDTELPRVVVTVLQGVDVVKVPRVDVADVTDVDVVKEPRANVAEVMHVNVTEETHVAVVEVPRVASTETPCANVAEDPHALSTETTSANVVDVPIAVATTTEAAGSAVVVITPGRIRVRSLAELSSRKVVAKRQHVKKERRGQGGITEPRSSSWGDAVDSDETVSLSDDEALGNPALQEQSHRLFIASIQRTLLHPIVEFTPTGPLMLDVLGTTPDLTGDNVVDAVSALCPSCGWRARHSAVRFHDDRASLAFCPRCPAPPGQEGAAGTKLHLLFWLELAVAAGDGVFDLVAAGPVVEELFCCTTQEFLFVDASREHFLEKLCRSLRFHGTLLLATVPSRTSASAAPRSRGNSRESAAIAAPTRQEVVSMSTAVDPPKSAAETDILTAEPSSTETELVTFLGRLLTVVS